jgi:hypothetical protein
LKPVTEDGDGDDVFSGRKDMKMYDTSRGPFHAILDKMALALQAQIGGSYAKSFTTVYEDPANALLRDGAQYDHLAKSMDAMHGTSKSLVPVGKAAAPPDPAEDYVDPNLNPAHAELDRLVVARMKNNPRLSYQQSFTREYLSPANRGLKTRVDVESIEGAAVSECARLKFRRWWRCWG